MNSLKVAGKDFAVEWSIICLFKPVVIWPVAGQGFQNN